MTDKKPLTHTAYAFKREGRTRGRWVEVGIARLNAESGGVLGHHVYLDRTPIGGYTGHIYLLPIGVKPGDPPQPVRPSDQTADDDEDL